MKLCPVGLNQQPPEGDKNCLNSELWHACAGPLVSLPSVGSHVVYFPQGHSEQVAASTNKEVDAQTPNCPSLSPQLICRLHNATMHADIETDEVYAQMTLQPLSPLEQKEVSFIPADLGAPSKQPMNYFCKTLTASDTSTHGGFSVPRRAAEKVFPPLDFSLQPPVQELIAMDLHNNEWKFRHIFRGQPKRHLLTTGWSIFVSAKRLVAGDSVLFIWNEKNQLLLGIRRANRQQTILSSSVLSSDSMHFGLLAAAAHAASTNSRFTIFYNPRASPCEFVIPLAKYVKAVYHTRASVGMRFRMLFETEESSIRRYMGTITGISDLDPAHWPNSHWRSVKVGWDESTAGERQQRVSLWEIEPLTMFPKYPSPLSLRLKRPWPLGLPSFPGVKTDGMGLNSSLIWLGGDVGDRGMQSVNQGMTMAPRMQARLDSSVQNNYYQATAAAAAIQDMQVVDPSRQPQQVCSQLMGMVQPQMLLQSQSFVTFPQTLLGSLCRAPESHTQQQLLHQNSLNSVQMQQEQQEQQTTSGQNILDPQQVFATAPQAQPQTTMQSILPMHQNFSESKVEHVAVPFQDEASNLFNVPPRSSNLLSCGDWPVKRIALDPLISSGTSQTVSPNIDQLGPVYTNLTSNPVSLPPFPGRESFIEQEGSGDPPNHFLFGVSIDSSSLILPSCISNLQGVGSDSDHATVPFAPSSFKSSPCVDCSIKHTVTSSSCIDESPLPESNNFVKVYKSGSFGRSLDITKFSSYDELRNELAQMFGLEGQLENHLRSGWQLVFVDRENDVLLLGDDPWPEFVNSVWCIKILSPQEVCGMGKGGLELLNSIPHRKLTLLNGNCDGYAGQQVTRNMNASMPSVGTLDF